MNILEGCLFLFVPHQLLKTRQAHVFIRFVCAEGVPEGMDTDLCANPGLFQIPPDFVVKTQAIDIVEVIA